jgi:hypothetical protein
MILVRQVMFAYLIRFYWPTSLCRLFLCRFTRSVALLASFQQTSQSLPVLPSMILCCYSAYVVSSFLSALAIQELYAAFDFERCREPGQIIVTPAK